MNEQERFYFWEEVPHYGVRQMGRVDGYESVDELKQNNAFALQYNKEHGHRTWVMKSAVHEVVVEGEERER